MVSKRRFVCLFLISPTRSVDELFMQNYSDMALVLLYFRSSLDLILQLNFWEGTEAILSYIFIGLVKIPSVVELQFCMSL
jgi:hypothetical protein